MDKKGGGKENLQNKKASSLMNKHSKNKLHKYPCMKKGNKK